jgi:NADH:ubiquinone oxidoreductase subunit 2 (subunit N)
MQAMLAAAAIGVIFLGVVPSPLLNAAQRAAEALR